MNANPISLVTRMAENHRLCLADWPTALKAEDLAAPPGEQEALLGGLQVLHGVIAGIYDHFAGLAPEEAPGADLETLGKAMERPAKLLWVLGIHGQVVQGAEGDELRIDRQALDRAMKPWNAKEAATDLAVLEAVGLAPAYFGADGAPCAGYKTCASLVLRGPAGRPSVWRALAYYAARMPAVKKGRTNTGPLITVFMRADFRPLLPGYTFYYPHLPATEEEVTRTMDRATLQLWQALKDFMSSHYPKYGLHYRVPRLRDRWWMTDYSRNGKDYGAWSVLTDEEGLYVRIAFSAKGVPYLLERIDRLSPAFQEVFLRSVRCKDCVRCGKHVMFTHGDHEHRLCKTPWYVSARLRPEDLPDIEQLIALRLAG